MKWLISGLEKLKKMDNKEIDIQLSRCTDNGTTTIGKITIGNLEILSIEDTNRDLNHDGDLTDPGEKKVYGLTRVPCGRYEIKFREWGGLHEKYKARFVFHKGMLWLIDVPSFEDIYIHIMNYARESLGCIGTGSHQVTPDWVDDSEKAYIALYGYCMCLFDLEYRVFINIIDNEHTKN
jgi:hypothetical protein